MDCQEDSPRWEVVSSSGREIVDCRFLDYLNDHSKIVCSLEAKGFFFDRAKRDFSPPFQLDFHVTLPQVLLDIESIVILRDKLTRWIEKYEEFDLSIGTRAHGDQSLLISLGKAHGKIHSQLKPVLTFSFVCPSSMDGKWSFIVDQSCIGIWAHELSQFLSRLE